MVIQKKTFTQNAIMYNFTWLSTQVAMLIGKAIENLVTISQILAHMCTLS
jgi:hypothetical protein